MHIAKVKIIDTLGIEELEFTAGRWNEITGKNGEGKTSVLEALRDVFEGGKDATLIRVGSERSERVIVLDDGTTIRKRLGKGAGVTIEKDGVRLDKPQERLKAISDMLSVNPVAFLNAKPDKRVNVLLETMPMQADPERIRQIIGQPSYALQGSHALAQIQAAYDEVFAQRREVNRAAKEKESTINQLSAALPAAAGAGGDLSEAEVEAKLAELDAAKEAEDQRIDTKLGGFQREHEARVETMQTEIGAIREQIAALQTKIAETQERIASERAAFEVTRGRANQQRQNKIAEWRSNRQPLEVQLGMIRENREAAVRAATTRDNIRHLRSEVEQLETDSAKHTTALDALDAYKSELLAALPIPGLVVTKDGELERNGVPFQRLNKAQQVAIAVDIAKMRAGDLRVVCVDELESLDSEARDELLRLAEEADLQFFVTRVSDGPLTVNAH